MTCFYASHHLRKHDFARCMLHIDFRGPSCAGQYFGSQNNSECELQNSKCWQLASHSCLALFKQVGKGNQPTHALKEGVKCIDWLRLAASDFKIMTINGHHSVDNDWERKVQIWWLRKNASKALPLTAENSMERLRDTSQTIRRM